MKRTSHSFTILRGIAVATNAASVKNLCGNVRLGWNDTNWRVRQVFVTSTAVGCTTPRHLCFNVWTMKESPSSTHWDSTLIEQPSTSNASSTERIYLPTVIACSGLLVTFRWVWVWLPTCRGTRLHTVMSQTATRTNWWVLWCAVSVPLATQHLICCYHRTITYWTSWRHERRLGTKPNARCWRRMNPNRRTTRR